MPRSDAGEAIALSVDAVFSELTIPTDSRDGAAPDARVPVSTWVADGWDGELRVWTAQLPIRPRALFFNKPPAGMTLEGPGGTVRFSKTAKPEQETWRFSENQLTLRLPGQAGPPDGYALRYPRARSREERLNWAFSGIDAPAAFVRAEVQAGPESRAGLLLPAPSVAAFDLTVPAAGELTFAPGLVQPETADLAPSDGATLVVEVDAAGVTSEVFRTALTDDEFATRRVDLSRWAGERVRLRLRTEPGASTTFDYAFVADPVVTSHTADPKRVVLIFVDTLRPDHLSVYGYPRDTSPALAAFAEQAAVFEQARSVAPWTLPSYRTVTTGRYPGHWDLGPTLQQRLRQHGWATAMFAGNIYLSAPFEGNRDWGLHHVVNWPPANIQVDQALGWLADQEGRDAAVLVHFMDAHLPYLEPAAYRRKFAGEAHPSLGEEFHRSHVRRGRLDGEARKYVQDRYDNNIRFVDDEVGRLLRQLPDDAVVVFFSDHGEEFWDHQGFEHGHTVYDELLRVPLIVRAPELAAGRYAEHTSLLDVVPTVLDLVGLPADGVHGRSLVPLTRGATEAFASRPLAFGDPLYGSERWGVLDGTDKYAIHEGDETVFDLATDPGERRNRLRGDAGGPFREQLANALKTPVDVGFRLVDAPSRTAGPELVVQLRVPGGIAAAWVGDDPRKRSQAEVFFEGEAAVVKWAGGQSGPREVYVMPVLPVEEVTHRVEMTARLGDDVVPLAVPSNRAPGLDGSRAPLTRHRFASGRSVAVGFGIAPRPVEGGTAVEAYDPEVAEFLRMAGYAVGDDETAPEDDISPDR